MNSVSYGPYWTPAVVVWALLTLMVVPYLALIVLMLALLATAAAGVSVTARVVAAAPNLARRSIRPRAGARADTGQLSAIPPAVGTVIHD